MHGVASACRQILKVLVGGAAINSLDERLHEKVIEYCRWDSAAESEVHSDMQVLGSRRCCRMSR